MLVQRLCGICPVSHHLAAAKATDQLIGVRTLTPTAEKVRRLMHLGQTLQSYALHFFHLSSPDLIFGYDDPVAHRNIVGLIADHPDIALKGIKLRKFGQEVIRVTAGKRVHGIGAIPGGVNKAVSPEERAYLLKDVDQIIEWGREAVRLISDIYRRRLRFNNHFGAIRSNMLSLVRSDGALELYDGRLRATDADGKLIFDDVECDDYFRHIHEQVKAWSYMKFPFLVSLGKDRGWYRVGPLARVNNCTHIDTPLAETERKKFAALVDDGPVHPPLAYHWARMIELLHTAEHINVLLHDTELSGKDLLLSGEPQPEGIGVIEAPRGTLFHHYRVDNDGLVAKANLIVSTTNNNQAMNETIRQVASRHLDGKTMNESLLNHIEVAIRAYDPCLSCATHALGKMPLQVELVGHDGTLLERLEKHSSGQIDRCDT